MSNGVNRVLVFCILIALLSSTLAPAVSAVAEGPFVEMTGINALIEVGTDTGFTVRVYMLDGSDRTGMDLITVTVSTDVGTVTPASDITDENGYCYFTYEAPASIDEPVEATVTAVAQVGSEPYPSTSDSTLVTFRLVGEVIGPAQVVAGGPNADYIIHVSANGQPIPQASVTIVLFGKGSIVSKQSNTDVNGNASFVYAPPASGTGQGSLMIQVGKMGYERSAVSFIIQVVGSLAPLVVNVASDMPSLPSWGSCNLTATVTRGETPVAGATIDWTASQGWLQTATSTTGAGGTARIQYTATAGAEGPWSGDVTLTVSATSGEDIAGNTTIVAIVEELPALNTYLSCRVEGTQLFPGEHLVVNVSLSENGGSDFVAAFGVDLVIWDDLETEFLRTPLISGQSMVPDYQWNSQWRAVYTVPASPETANYTWDVEVVSVDGVQVYQRLSQRNHMSVHAEGKDDWTIMVYIAADNNLAGMADYMVDQLEKKAPRGEYTVLLNWERVRPPDQWLNEDNKWYVMRRYELARDSTARSIGSTIVHRNPPQPYNSGLGDNVYDFLMWGSSYAPAGRYSLVMWDHGAAYAGMCTDDRENDDLEVWELSSALRDFGSDRRKLEVLVFDMCLESSLEVAIRLKDVANYMVASEITIDRDLLVPETLELINAYYPASPPTPVQLATDMIAGFADRHGNMFPFAVLDLAKVNEFTTVFDDMSQHILDAWDPLGECVMTAYLDADRIEGPYSETFWLIDARQYLERLSDEMSVYVLDPVAREAFIASQDLLDAFDDMVLSVLPVETYDGVNMFFPPNGDVWADQMGDYLNTLTAFHPWFLVMDYTWNGPPEDEQDPDMPWPPIPGIFTYPIDDPQVLEIDEDDDGQAEVIELDVVANSDNNTSPLVVVLDMLTFGAGRGGSIEDLHGRTVWTVPAGTTVNKHLELTSPSYDTNSLVLTVLTEDGQLVQRKYVGHYPMNATPPSGAPPSLAISSSATVFQAGGTVTLTAVVEPGVDIWWDVDRRNGIGIDGTTASMDATYRRPGAVEVTCIASDGTQVSVKRLNLTVQVAVGNTDPVPGLEAEQTAPLTATMDASTSSDADGDELEYWFTFGDGTWSGWTTGAAVDHEYEEVGTYNASVRVRDSRGSPPVRTFLEVTVTGDASNRAPQASLTLSATDVEVGDTVTTDGSTSTDPDGDALEYRVTWGDGEVTDWSGDNTATHVFTVEGTFTVSLDVRDPAGLGATATMDVKVDPAPVVTNRPPVASMVLGAATIMVDEEVTADGSSSIDTDIGDVLEYRFDWGDGDVTEWSGNPKATHAYETGGIYTVELEVRDKGGLIDHATDTLEVTPPKDDKDDDESPGPVAMMTLLALVVLVVVRRRRGSDATARSARTDLAETDGHLHEK